jgi:hypothetical protein
MPLVERTRLRERVLRIQVLPRLHLRLDFADARKAGGHQLLGADRPVADGSGGVRRGKPVELGGVHRSISVQFPYISRGSHVTVPGRTYTNNMDRSTI